MFNDVSRKWNEAVAPLRAVWAKVPSRENIAMGVGTVGFVAGVVALVVSMIVLHKVAADSPGRECLSSARTFGIVTVAISAVLFALGFDAHRSKEKAAAAEKAVDVDAGDDAQMDELSKTWKKIPGRQAIAAFGAVALIAGLTAFIIASMALGQEPADSSAIPMLTMIYDVGMYSAIGGTVLALLGYTAHKNKQRADEAEARAAEKRGEAVKPAATDRTEEVTAAAETPEE